MTGSGGVTPAEQRANAGSAGSSDAILPDGAPKGRAAGRTATPSRARSSSAEKAPKQGPEGPLSSRCVVGYSGMLNDAIDAGKVPKPALMDYQAWKHWRATDGMRPAVRRGSPKGCFTTDKDEIHLWKFAMRHLYGNEWAKELQRQTLRENADLALRVEAEQASRAEAESRAAAAAPSNVPSGSGGLAGAGLAQALAIPRIARVPATPGGSSALSSLPGSPRGLRQSLLSYDPAKLSLDSYTRRIVRIASHLEDLGAALTPEESGEIVAAAGIVRDMGSKPHIQTVDDEIRYLKGCVCTYLIEEADLDEAEEEGEDLTLPGVIEQARLNLRCQVRALVRLLRARGVTVSSSDKKVFSGGPPTETASPAAEQDQGAGAPRPGLDAYDMDKHKKKLGLPYPKGTAGEGKADAGEGSRAVHGGNVDNTKGGGDVPVDQVPTPLRGGGSDLSAALMELAKGQAETVKAIKEGLMGNRSSSPNRKGDGLHSVMQIRPNLQWPTISDSDSGEAIEKAFERFEDITGMSNDNKGMLPRERLAALKQILKVGSSKEKIYINAEKMARATGEWTSDPDKVYLSIKGRLLRFREEAVEKKRRLHGAWSDLFRGNKDVLTFEADWDGLVAELATVGIVKDDETLYLDYLAKIGKDMAKRIRLDLRSWPDGEGGLVHRRASTWMECHQLALEFERIDKETNCITKGVNPGHAFVDGGVDGDAAAKQMQLVQTVVFDAQGNAIQAFMPKGTVPGQTKPKKEKGGQQDKAKGVCFKMRDTGSCDNKDCKYSHDPKELEAARLALGIDVKAFKAGPKAKAKAKAKGKAKGGGKGDKNAEKEKQARFDKQKALADKKIASGEKVVRDQNHLCS